MLGKFVLVLFLTTVVSSYGYYFKTCAGIPYCTKFRSHQPSNDQKYKADFNTVNKDDHKFSVSLKNNKNETLLLVLYWIGDTARIQINEPNTNRFFLRAGQSLLVEPKPNKLGGKTITNKQITVYNYKKTARVIIENVPEFSLKAYNIHNEQVITLKGDRLYMENTHESQVFTFSVDFNAPKLYGLFDHSWKLALNETGPKKLDPFRVKNQDPWGYYANNPMALYGSVPAIYGHSASQTSGIFLHNAAEQWIDITYKSENTSSAYFNVFSAAFDLFLFLGPGPIEVVKQMTDLTGRAPLPQQWTLGYHQCRFSYMTQEEVVNVTTQMETRGFPMDAIWLDGDHLDGFRYFKWNKKTYTNPLGMLKILAQFKKVAVSLSDPHFKIDKNYDVYMGAKNKYFVKWDNGSDYEGICWPGAASWIDFFNPEAAEYYSSWYSYDKFKGTNPTLAGIWNDMNEPAITNITNENTVPYEIVHRLNRNETVLNRDVHNLYGLMHTKATHHGLLERDNFTKRPFILTRSSFAGSQRYAATWTGDCTTTFEHLQNSFSQCMTANLLGIVFCGADVPGFFKNPTQELAQRWYQAGAWLPFYRAHSDKSTHRREPYLFPEATQDVIREAIKLRYKHIPYWYTLFYDHSINGGPLVSPLFYRYPGIQERDTQMLVGEDIMVVNVVQSKVKTVEVLFPGSPNEIWYRVDKDPKKPQVFLGGQLKNIGVDIKTSPVFYRGGSIILTYDPVKTSTFQMQNDSFVAYVNTNKEGKATGRIYADDYTSYDYLKNDFVYWELNYNHTSNLVTFRNLGGKSIRKILLKAIIVSTPVNASHSEQFVHKITSDGTLLNDMPITEETEFRLGSQEEETLHSFVELY